MVIGATALADRVASRGLELAWSGLAAIDAGLDRALAIKKLARAQDDLVCGSASVNNAAIPNMGSRRHSNLSPNRARSATCDLLSAGDTAPDFFAGSYTIGRSGEPKGDDGLFYGMNCICNGVRVPLPQLRRSINECL